uniref:Uncharacterized protein n=1 Tax=Pararge aegeria TaxID=116150 RepID=S4P4D3_9NEOP
MKYALIIKKKLLIKTISLNTIVDERHYTREDDYTTIDLLITFQSGMSAMYKNGFQRGSDSSLYLRNSRSD